MADPMIDRLLAQADEWRERWNAEHPGHHGKPEDWRLIRDLADEVHRLQADNESWLDKRLCGCGDELRGDLDARCGNCSAIALMGAEGTIERLRAENERLEAKAESCRKAAHRSGNRRREMQRLKVKADRNTAIVAEQRDALRAELDRARPVLDAASELIPPTGRAEGRHLVRAWERMNAAVRAYREQTEDTAPNPEPHEDTTK